MLFTVVFRLADCGKAACVGDCDTVDTCGAMDDLEIAVFIPAADYADVGIVRVKHKVARLGVIPRDFRAVGALAGRTAAVTYDVFAVRGVVEHPIHIAGAIDATRPVGASSFASLRGDKRQLTPTGITANRQRFATPKETDLQEIESA